MNYSRRKFLQVTGVTTLSLLASGCAQNPMILPNDPKQSTNWDELYANALGTIPSTARWVATTGNDNNSGSATRPFQTIARALQGLPKGGQVIIKDGVYSGANNWINAVINPIPNGLSDSQRTIIRAENRFKVRIVQNARPSGYYQSIVHLEPSSQHIWIDGFIAETTWEAARADDNAAFVINDNGNNNRITRVIVKHSSCSRYGGSFAFGKGALLEDCHSVGSGRYAFYGGSGGDSVPSGKAVLRRCTSYMPFGPVLEPTASFSFYGSNDGAYDLCRDVLFANCYELDSPHLRPAQTDGNNLKWASFYLPKSVRNIRHLGCGSLNGGAEYGVFSTDNYGGDNDVLAEYNDCFAWDLRQNSSSFVAAFRKADNGIIRVSQCTAGLIPGDNFSLPSSTESSNNLFIDDLAYLPLRTAGKGADQRYAVGQFLSSYGATGFDQAQTQMPLWAFPYETELAAITAESIPKPSGDMPVDVSSSKNPFATSGLTKRIWQATGRTMPDFSSIYG
jgi:Protein of unknown function (DUF1565)